MAQSWGQRTLWGNVCGQTDQTARLRAKRFPSRERDAEELSRILKFAARSTEEVSQCILAEGAIALSVTLSGGALFAS